MLKSPFVSYSSGLKPTKIFHSSCKISKNFQNHKPAFDLIAIDKSWVDIWVRVPALPGHDQKVLGQFVGKQPVG
jgi:hypothetical protein